LIFLASCSSEPDNPATGGIPPTQEFENGWAIPVDEVLDGGVGKDGIPSIDNPKFATIDDGQTRPSYLDALVVGVVNNGKARAYPHPILDWHEIVNDDLDNMSLALTYCPLTGTAIGWNRIVNNGKTEFGVSGLLYNTNLMPYDRVTGSTWSQQRLDCVNGTHIGRKIDLIPVVETTLTTWLEAYPDSEILTEDTGFSRDYTRYPYGDYRTNNSNIFFPISNRDTRLPEKQRVLGVFANEGVKAYPFSQDSGTNLIQENVNGVDLVIARNTEKNFIVAFENPGNLTFTASQNFPAMMEDENGVSYNLTGEVLSGDGSDLTIANSFIGYWFSFGTFYPDIELHED
jgi:hypothetical protein